MKGGNIKDMGVYERMLGKEMLLLNQNIVIRTRSLKDLLKEGLPSIPNKEGEPYMFDAAALKKAAAKYPDYKHDIIMLPIHFYVDMEVSNECYVRDEYEAEFLKKIAGLGGYLYKKGKMWIPRK